MVICILCLWLMLGIRYWKLKDRIRLVGLVIRIKIVFEFE